MSPSDLVQDLTIGRRQMVEIARAFTVTDAPARLVILDEPTSSLDAHTAGQLLAHVRRSVAVRRELRPDLAYPRRGAVRPATASSSCATARWSMADAARNFDRAKLVGAMGGVEPEAPRAQAAAATAARGETPVVVRVRPERQTDEREFVAREGEIIGLAGLAGHGQTDLLLATFAAASRPRAGATVNAPVALVAGDRQSDGVFPGWSIAQNIGVRSLEEIALGAAALAPASRTSSPTLGASASRSARPTSTTPFSRSRAATSRRRCSRARSAPTRGSC